jgi:ABC-type branched-subunit amino acid transport system substrate-binding protein
MMFNLRLLPLLIIVFCVSLISYAQTPPVAVVADTLKTTTLNGVKYYLFTPKQGQTLYSISKAYAVSIDDINTANPTLLEGGLKIGQTIKVPTKKSVTNTVAVVTDPIAKPITIPTSVVLTDSFRLAMAAKCKREQKKKSSYTVALFLPLNANGDGTSENKPTSSVAVEFYEGAIMAAEDFRNDSVSIKLIVFDTKNDSTLIKDILADINPIKPDLVVGPLFASAFQKVTAHYKNENVVCVSPFSQTFKVIENMPNAHKVTPTAITIVDQCARYITTHYAKKNIVLLTTKFSKDAGTMSLYRNRLQSGLNDTTQTIKEFALSANGQIPENLLSATTENLIVFPSCDQATVSLLLAQLSNFSGKYKINLWGLNQWQSYDGLDLVQLSKVNLLFARTAYVNQEDAVTVEVNKRYRAKYKTDASEYFYQGYDVMDYYLGMLAKYGSNLTPCLLCQTKEDKGIQANFLYGANGPANGIENTSISIMQYKNNSIIKVN